MISPFRGQSTFHVKYKVARIFSQPRWQNKDLKFPPGIWRKTSRFTLCYCQTFSPALQLQRKWVPVWVQFFYSNKHLGISSFYNKYDIRKRVWFSLKYTGSRHHGIAKTNNGLKSFNWATKKDIFYQALVRWYPYSYKW